MAGHVPREPERIIGRYALFDQIGAGGMATVHFGRLLGPAGFSKTVAIKRLHPHFARDPEFSAMFLDEARLAARIQHPNVVATLDVVAREGELFLVMEFVEGLSLAGVFWEAVRSARPIPVRVVGAIMVNLLSGLHAAHEATNEQGHPLSLIHRDVSPQNVLVGRDGVARVLDFGIAKAIGRSHTTREGRIKGKLAYMPPEQIKAQQLDRRVDIYAASVVLWELLTMRRLFDEDDDATTIWRAVHEDPPIPSSIQPGLPPGTDELVMRGLAKDPTQRFATAREMAIAIEQILGVESTLQVGDYIASCGREALEKMASKVREIESISEELHTSDIVPDEPRAPKAKGKSADSIIAEAKTIQREAPVDLPELPALEVPPEPSRPMSSGAPSSIGQVDPRRMTQAYPYGADKLQVPQPNPRNATMQGGFADLIAEVAPSNPRVDAAFAPAAPPSRPSGDLAHSFGAPSSSPQPASIPLSSPLPPSRPSGPGSAMPSSPTPGSGMPGSGMPGSGMPGSAMPASSGPVGPGAGPRSGPSPMSRPQTNEPIAMELVSSPRSPMPRTPLSPGFSSSPLSGPRYGQRPMPARAPATAGIPPVVIAVLGIALVGGGAYVLFGRGKSGASKAAQMSAPPPGGVERSCEAARKSIQNGGELGPFDTYGWVVEVWLAREDGEPIGTTDPSLLKLRGPDGALDPSFGIKLGEANHGEVSFESAPSPPPATGKEPGVVVRLSSGYASAFFSSEARPAFLKLADGVFDDSKATIGAMYARCGHLPYHDIGAWFRGKDPQAAADAIGFQMAGYAEAPWVQRSIFSPVGKDGTSLESYRRKRMPIDSVLFGDQVRLLGGSAEDTAGKGLTIVFPLTSPLRAMSTARWVTKQSGLE